MSQDDPPEQEKRLTSKQRDAALLLACATTIKDTATAIGISEKTIDRWKHNPAFLVAIRDCEDEIYDAALRRLKRVADEAIACLERNMSPDHAAPYVQVAAASKLLDAGLQVSKVQELEKLLAELEARLQA